MMVWLNYSKNLATLDSGCLCFSYLRRSAACFVGVNCQRHRFALVLNLDEAVMESGNSDPEMYVTQSSPRRKRTFPTLDVLCEDTLAPDEDIRALAGDINEVEEQPSATGFDRFAAPVSETEVRAKIDDCVPKSTRYKDKWAVALL